MLKEIIQSRQLYLLLGIFSIFVFLFSRTFMGVFILSYRTGEIVFLLSLFFFLLSIFINPGILLLSPTEHDRFDHYDGNLRKES